MGNITRNMEKTHWNVLNNPSVAGKSHLLVGEKRAISIHFLRLMEEIPNKHLRCITPANNGIKYIPQLVLLAEFLKHQQYFVSSQLDFKGHLQRRETNWPQWSRMKTRLSFGAPKNRPQPGDYVFRNKRPQESSTIFSPIYLARSAWDLFPWEVGHYRRQASKLILENFNIFNWLIVSLRKKSGVLSAFLQEFHKKKRTHTKKKTHTCQSFQMSTLDKPPIKQVLRFPNYYWCLPTGSSIERCPQPYVPLTKSNTVQSDAAICWDKRKRWHG